MRDVAKGDLGYSFWQKDKSIADMVIRRGPITLQISLMALLIAWVIGLPTGIVTALWRNSALDYGIRGVVTLFMAIPNFWLGLAMILATILIWNWRPPGRAGRRMGVALDQSADDHRAGHSHGNRLWRDHSQNGALRYARSADRGLRPDRVGQGLASRTVVVRHALRNALLPTITLSSLYLGATLGGAVAVERAFSVPGLGYSLIYAVQARDWTVIQSLVLLFAVAYVVINLVVDVIYGLVDPRIRYE